MDCCLSNGVRRREIKIFSHLYGRYSFDVENHVTGVVSHRRIAVCGTIIEQLCDCFHSGSSGANLLCCNNDDGCDHISINGACVLD